MPAAFVQVGNHWINLELVTGVELVEDANQPGKIIAARVHFTTGKQQDFQVGTDVQALATFLRNHKAV